MERNYKLYVHIAPNGKKYYGITKQKPEHRWANGKGYNNQHFTNAINKYGWDNIEHIVIYNDLTEDEAKELEQYMIQWYNTANRDYGYNISLGGEAGNDSEETRRKKSKAQTGKRRSEEQRRNMSEAQRGEKHPMYGKHHTEETKKKISEAHKGRTFSEEHRRKKSEAQRGKNNPIAKSVICITTNKVFDTITDAAKYYNIEYSGISKCCKNKRKTSGSLPDGTKLVWKYIDIIEL